MLADEGQGDVPLMMIDGRAVGEDDQRRVRLAACPVMQDTAISFEGVFGEFHYRSFNSAGSGLSSIQACTVRVNSSGVDMLQLCSSASDIFRV